MKHFLITQFNLKGVAKEITKQKWLEWNKYRFQFFEDYTLPSILNQSSKEFIWLIFFDKDTPESCLNFVQKWSKYDIIEPVFIMGIKEFQKRCKEIILEMSSGEKWIITSRIDNDDALHFKGIAEIQKNFVEKDKQIISLASGYVFDVKSELLAHYYYFRSPFISLIEENNKDTFVGVYYYSHTQWPGIKFSFFSMIKGDYSNKSIDSTIYLVDFPYWVQMIHNNLENTFQRGFPVLKERSLRDFSLEIISKKGSVFSIPKFYNYYLWKRYIWAILFRKLFN